MMRSSLLLLSVAISLSSCQKSVVQPEEESTTVLKLPVTRVSVESISEQVLLPGLVLALPDHSVKVSPGIAGKLVDVQASPGQHVAKGQIIARIDSRQLTDQVNSAHAKVLVANAGVQQAKTNLLLAQNTEERNKRLVQQDVGAVKDLVLAQSQVDTARAQILAAQAQVADAQAAESAARAQLTYTIVKSPIAGLVAQRFLNVSDSADTTTAIAQIVDLAQVIVEASQPTSQPAKISPGESATVTAVSLAGLKLAGKVQSIDPVTDNQGTTIGIRILCPNPGCVLKEGMPVIASIVTAVHSQALTVPLTALVADPAHPDRKMVYLYKQGKVTRVVVKTGMQKDTRIEVLSGLNAGQEIIASGGYGIPDGTEVEAQSESLHADSKVTSKSD